MDRHKIRTYYPLIFCDIDVNSMLIRPLSLYSFCLNWGLPKAKESGLIKSNNIELRVNSVDSESNDTLTGTFTSCLKLKIDKLMITSDLLDNLGEMLRAVWSSV